MRFSVAVQYSVIGTSNAFGLVESNLGPAGSNNLLGVVLSLLLIKAQLQVYKHACDQRE